MEEQDIGIQRPLWIVQLEEEEEEKKNERKKKKVKG